MSFTALGLAVSFIGATVFAAEGTRVVNLGPIKDYTRWERKQDAISELVNETELYETSDHFEAIITLVQRNQTEIVLPADPTEIHYATGWGTGANILIENEHGEEARVGSPARLRNWIERETRELFFKWGMVLVALGFALQFIGVWY